MSVDGFDIKVQINEKDIEKKLENLIDDEVMIAVHTLFAKMINNWVPAKENILATSLDITKDYVRYTQPYAHYMYVGEVYGPNIPINENGQIIGWFSPPGQKKYPTGKDITYNTSLHENASKEWDKVAMQTQLEPFEKQVKEILVRRAKKLYG